MTVSKNDKTVKACKVPKRDRMQQLLRYSSTTALKDRTDGSCMRSCKMRLLESSSALNTIYVYFVLFLLLNRVKFLHCEIWLVSTHLL